MVSPTVEVEIHELKHSSTAIPEAVQQTFIRNNATLIRLYDNIALKKRLRKSINYKLTEMFNITPYSQLKKVISLLSKILGLPGLSRPNNTESQARGDFTTRVKPFISGAYNVAFYLLIYQFGYITESQTLAQKYNELEFEGNTPKDRIIRQAQELPSIKYTYQTERDIQARLKVLFLWYITNSVIRFTAELGNCLVTCCSKEKAESSQSTNSETNTSKKDEKYSLNQTLALYQKLGMIFLTAYALFRTPYDFIYEVQKYAEMFPQLDIAKKRLKCGIEWPEVLTKKLSPYELKILTLTTIGPYIKLVDLLFLVSAIPLAPALLHTIIHQRLPTKIKTKLEKIYIKYEAAHNEYKKFIPAYKAIGLLLFFACLSPLMEELSKEYIRDIGNVCKDIPSFFSHYPGNCENSLTIDNTSSVKLKYFTTQNKLNSSILPKMLERFPQIAITLTSKTGRECSDPLKIHESSFIKDEIKDCECERSIKIDHPIGNFTPIKNPERFSCKYSQFDFLMLSNAAWVLTEVMRLYPTLIDATALLAIWVLARLFIPRVGRIIYGITKNHQTDRAQQNLLDDGQRSELKESLRSKILKEVKAKLIKVGDDLCEFSEPSVTLAMIIAFGRYLFRFLVFGPDFVEGKVYSDKGPLQIINNISSAIVNPLFSNKHKIKLKENYIDTMVLSTNQLFSWVDFLEHASSCLALSVSILMFAKKIEKIAETKAETPPRRMALVASPPITAP